MEPSISFKTLIIVIGIFTTAFAGVLGVCTALLGFALKGWIGGVKNVLENSLKTLRELFDQHEEFEKEQRELQREINGDLFERVNKLETKKFNEPNIVGKRGLIIDDEEQKANLTKMYLEMIGCVVDISNNCNDAKSRLRDGYDFLMTDWFLDGQHTAKEIIDYCIENNLFIKGDGRGYPVLKILGYSAQPKNPKRIKGMEWIDIPYGNGTESVKKILKDKIESFFV